MRFHTLMKFTWVNIAWHTIYTCEKCENASFESSDFVSSSFSKMPIDMIHLQRLPLPKQRVRATRCPWQCQLCPRSWCCQCHTPVKFNIGKKNVFENSKKKIKCQKQILLSSYGHHYLINQIHPNSNSCFGQKVTSIDKCYMTCFQLIFFPNRTLIDTNCLDWVCVLQDFPAVAPCHTRFAQLPPALASKDPEKDFSLQIQGHSLERWSAMAVRSSSDWKVQKYLDCIDMHDGACLADMCMVMAEAKISDLRLAGRGGRGCKSIWVWIKTMVTTTRKFGHL